MIDKLVSSQFLKFIFCGFAAALCNISAKIIIEEKSNYFFAILFSYLVGMIVAYILNSMYVFSSNKEKRLREIILFTSYNLFMVPVVLLNTFLVDSIIAGISGTNGSYTISHIIGVASPIILSFFYHKYVTFEEKDEI